MDSIVSLVLLIIGISFAGGVVTTFICSFLEKEKVKNRIALCTLLILILMSTVSYLVGEYAVKSKNGTYTSTPIPLIPSANLEGAVIKPLTVVKDNESILIVATDHRLYSLIGAQLEPGLSLTNMVGIDLIVFNKGKKVCIGIQEPEVKAVSTQIGYSNNTPNEHYQNALPKVK